MYFVFEIKRGLRWRAINVIKARGGRRAIELASGLLKGEGPAQRHRRVRPVTVKEAKKFIFVLRKRFPEAMIRVLGACDEGVLLP